MQLQSVQKWIETFACSEFTWGTALENSSRTHALTSLSKPDPVKLKQTAALLKQQEKTTNQALPST